MRNPQPFFRKFDGWWYVQIPQQGKRRQIRLAQGKANRAEAFRRYHELMAQQDPASLPDRSQVNLASLCDMFLDHSQRHHSASTFANYKFFLNEFCQVHGTLPVLQLKPFHVSRWLEGKSWAQATKRGAIISIKRVLNWAFEQGYLDAQLLRGLKRPPATRRTTTITSAQHEEMLAATDDAFREFLTALKETGARPGEVMALTAADVDLQQGLWILRKHKTAWKTGKPRIIYLTATMLATTRKLIEQRPTGALFRNSDGEAWTRNAVRLRMKRLREKLNLPAGTISYAYRHTFVTNSLVNGVPIATVAELVGHRDTAMISQHYAHLNQQVDYMRKAAEQAIR